MSEDRKATDVLLQIESKVDELLSYIKADNLANKIILERLRIVTESLEKLSLKPSSVSVSDSGKKPNLSVSADFTKPTTNVGSEQQQQKQLSDKISVTTLSLKDKIKKAMDDAKEDTSSLEFPAAKEQSKEKNTDKPISVQQKITDVEGSNLFMANVEIFDLNDVLIKKTKTNQTGKWLAQLPVGTYNVAVTKVGANNKPSINVKYSIEITNENSNLELPIKKV